MCVPQGRPTWPHPRACATASQTRGVSLNGVPGCPALCPLRDVDGEELSHLGGREWLLHTMSRARGSGTAWEPAFHSWQGGHQAACQPVCLSIHQSSVNHVLIYPLSIDLFIYLPVYLPRGMLRP